MQDWLPASLSVIPNTAFLKRVSTPCGDEYVVECDEVRRDGGVRTLVMYKSCVVKHYQARQIAWLLDRTDRTAS